MSARLIIPSLALLVTTAAYAGASSSRTEWTHETRPLGNKVVMDIYRRAAPYALTGSVTEPARRPAAGEQWVRETRQLGNKTAIDVYYRR